MAPAVAVKAVYRAVRKHGELAWGTPDAPIYGENTLNSMQRALESMAACAPDHAQWVFCDVGAGNGGPAMHAAAWRPECVAYGLEVVKLRWWFSQCAQLALLDHADDAVREAASRVVLAHADVSGLQDFGPCTHVYSFDACFEPELLSKVAGAVARSTHVKCYASFRKLSEFHKTQLQGRLQEHEALKMVMVGSGETKTLHVFRVLPLSEREGEREEGRVAWDELVREAKPREGEDARKRTKRARDENMPASGKRVRVRV